MREESMYPLDEQLILSWDEVLHIAQVNDECFLDLNRGPRLNGKQRGTTEAVRQYVARLDDVTLPWNGYFTQNKKRHGLEITLQDFPELRSETVFEKITAIRELLLFALDTIIPSEETVAYAYKPERIIAVIAEDAYFLVREVLMNEGVVTLSPSRAHRQKRSLDMNYADRFCDGMTNVIQGIDWQMPYDSSRGAWKEHLIAFVGKPQDMLI